MPSGKPLCGTEESRVEGDSESVNAIQFSGSEIRPDYLNWTQKAGGKRRRRNPTSFCHLWKKKVGLFSVQLEFLCVRKVQWVYSMSKQEMDTKKPN